VSDDVGYPASTPEYLAETTCLVRTEGRDIVTYIKEAARAKLIPRPTDASVGMTVDRTGLRSAEQRVAVGRVVTEPSTHSMTTPALKDHSVFSGCAVPAYFNHNVRRSTSIRYQIRLPAVTSYCHCSISLPLRTPEASVPSSR
jgi:hypothetical protein